MLYDLDSAQGIQVIVPLMMSIVSAPTSALI